MSLGCSGAGAARAFAAAATARAPPGSTAQAPRPARTRRARAAGSGVAPPSPGPAPSCEASRGTRPHRRASGAPAGSRVRAVPSGDNSSASRARGRARGAPSSSPRGRGAPAPPAGAERNPSGGVVVSTVSEVAAESAGLASEPLGPGTRPYPLPVTRSPPREPPTRPRWLPCRPERTAALAHRDRRRSEPFPPELADREPSVAADRACDGAPHAFHPSTPPPWTPAAFRASGVSTRRPSSAPSTNAPSTAHDRRTP